MKKLATMLSILALLPAGVLLAAEEIQANAVRLGAGPSTGFFQAVLDRYTTPEEHALWREAFRTQGQRAGRALAEGGAERRHHELREDARLPDPRGLLVPEREGAPSPAGDRL